MKSFGFFFLGFAVNFLFFFEAILFLLLFPFWYSASWFCDPKDLLEAVLVFDDS